MRIGNLQCSEHNRPTDHSDRRAVSMSRRSAALTAFFYFTSNIHKQTVTWLWRHGDVSPVSYVRRNDQTHRSHTDRQTHAQTGRYFYTHSAGLPVLLTTRHAYRIYQISFSLSGRLFVYSCLRFSVKPWTTTGASTWTDRQTKRRAVRQTDRRRYERKGNDFPITSSVNSHDIHVSSLTSSPPPSLLLDSRQWQDTRLHSTLAGR